MTRIEGFYGVPKGMPLQNSFETEFFSSLYCRVEEVLLAHNIKLDVPSDSPPRSMILPAGSKQVPPLAR
jgi:hypothetical protein